MAIQLKSTKGAQGQSVKVLVYGESGAGKTRLISTLESPVIFSTEKGLLTLSKFDLPYEEISSMDELREALAWAQGSDEAKKFGTVVLDSITDIAEVCLNAEKKKSADGRAAYGNSNDIMGEMIRSFRDLPGRDVYFSAQLDKVQDEKGRILYGPSMPGKSLTQQLPYMFDLCFALRVEKGEDGKLVRALMTEGDGLWLAKQRGDFLEPWEGPDLGAVIRKIRGTGEKK